MKDDYFRLALKPCVINAAEAHKLKRVSFEKDVAILFDDAGVKRIVPLNHQYDLTQATIFGLNERLTKDATSPKIDNSDKNLRDFFNEEWQKYSEALEGANGRYLDYGYYVYYQDNNDLVRFCSPFWHHIVSIASNAKLLTDKNNELSWHQIRNIFKNATIAVAGCSVGSNIIQAITQDLRPGQIKIADKSFYKMENINRVKLSYKDIVKSNDKKINLIDLGLKNKAEVTASQIYAIDPYMDIFVYQDGINETNINDFILGNKVEPKVDFIVEEVDDPKVKIFIRKYARKYKIPIIMATDIGSCVQIDVLRYDQDDTLSLTYGVSDEKIYNAIGNIESNPTSRKVFYSFVDTLIGTDYRQGELGKIIDGNVEIPTATLIPQLGSTIQVASGIVAEAIARMLLGHSYPSRMIFNKNTFETKIYQ